MHCNDTHSPHSGVVGQLWNHEFIKVQTTNCTWEVVPTYLAIFFLPDFLPLVHFHSFMYFYYQYLTQHLFFPVLCIILIWEMLGVTCSKMLFSLFLPSTGPLLQVLSGSAVQHCTTETPLATLPDHDPFLPVTLVPDIPADRYSVVLVIKHLRTF